MEINGFGGASLVLWSPRCDFQPPHIGIFDAAQVMGANIPGINDEEAKSAGGDNGGVMHIYEVLLLSPGLGMLEHRNSVVKATFVPKKGRASLWMMSKRGRRLIDTMMWPLFWVIRDEILLWSSLSRLVICSKDSHQWIWGKRSKNGFGGGLAGWCFSVFVSHPPWDPKLSSDWTGTEGIAKKGSETYPDVFCFF